MDIKNSIGYKSLLEAIEKDEARGIKNDHNYREKLQWIIDRVNLYAEATGLEASEILSAWEKSRSYWYMNYYQECNQPSPRSEKCRIFDTTEALLKSIGDSGFRCPNCDGVSKSPYVCLSGEEMREGVICDWKVYGLFKDMGKGIFVYCKSDMRGETIFMPIAWE